MKDTRRRGGDTTEEREGEADEKSAAAAEEEEDVLACSNALFLPNLCSRSSVLFFTSVPTFACTSADWNTVRNTSLYILRAFNL